MRDDFSEKTKRLLANRVGHACANPGCRAATSGPQKEVSGAINLGVAAHITAAAPEGPRFDPELTVDERSSSGNGIWLCQNCAKLIDSDLERFSAPILRKWKADAELEAYKRLGKGTVGSGQKSVELAERQLRRDLGIRDKMQRDFLKPPEERPRPYARFPYERFQTTNVIVRNINQNTYPEVDNGRSNGPSNWFKPEVYDFYYNGLEVVVGLHRGVMDREGHWCIIDHDAAFDSGTFQEIKVLQLGKIPWRNIRHYDMEGDESYTCPHLYCAYADNDSPYEGYAYAVIGDDSNWPLEDSKQLPPEAVVTPYVSRRRQPRLRSALEAPAGRSGRGTASIPPMEQEP